MLGHNVHEVLRPPTGLRGCIRTAHVVLRELQSVELVFHVLTDLGLSGLLLFCFVWLRDLLQVVQELLGHLELGLVVESELHPKLTWKVYEFRKVFLFHKIQTVVFCLIRSSQICQLSFCELRESQRHV